MPRTKGSKNKSKASSGGGVPNVDATSRLADPSPVLRGQNAGEQRISKSQLLENLAHIQSIPEKWI